MVNYTISVSRDGYSYNRVYSFVYNNLESVYFIKNEVLEFHKIFIPCGFMVSLTVSDQPGGEE